MSEEKRRRMSVAEMRERFTVDGWSANKVFLNSGQPKRYVREVLKGLKRADPIAKRNAKMRELANDNHTIQDIAGRFGISRNTVRKAIGGER